jgi:hypothetical protein
MDVMWVLMQGKTSSASIISLVRLSIYYTTGWMQSAEDKKISGLPSTLNLVSGHIIDYGTPKFYAGGSSPWDLYIPTTSSSSSPGRVSFVHNFDPAGNILLD